MESYKDFNAEKLSELENDCQQLIMKINALQIEVDKQPNSGLNKFLGLLKCSFKNLQFQIETVNSEYKIEEKKAS